MGFLTNFFLKTGTDIRRLPSGSMTVDGNGRILASTFSSRYSAEVLEKTAAQVLRLLHESRSAQMPLAEVSLQFASLQVTARELGTGAMIFIKPRG
jgi:hypothetical protein